MEVVSTLSPGWAGAVRLARLYWGAKGNSTAWTWLAAVLALQVAKGKAATLLSDCSRDTLSALTDGPDAGRTRRLWRSAATKAAFLVMLAPLDTVYQWVLRELKQAWSKSLTDALLDGYLKVALGRASGVQGETSAGRTDDDGKSNLDQRVAEDVDKFVDLFLDLSLEMAQAGIHLVFFARVLWRASPWLSQSTVSLAIAGTLGTVLIGQRLPALYQRERDASNNFRYALTRVRENAESIAFYNGERSEIAAIRDLHAAKQRSISMRKTYRDAVGAASGTFRKVTGILPFLALVRTASRGGRDELNECASGHNHSHSHGHGHSHGGAVKAAASTGIGAVLQASEAFDEILYHLMIIAENLNDFARLSAVADQLSNILGRIAADRLVPGRAVPPSRISLTERSLSDEDMGDGTPWLAIRGLSVSCKGEPLIEGLNLDLVPGSRLLISGESGVGKTTLLRAIQGLYDEGVGKVLRPPKDEIQFIPQQPYMTLGSLREQLFYPLPRDQADHSRAPELVDVLRLVGLEPVLERAAQGLDTVSRWSEELSIGEQQRLAFARIILIRPPRPFVVLDEATSACDLVSEAKMYALLEASCSSWISVGHRASIERFHDQRLVLHRGGTWDLQPLP